MAVSINNDVFYNNNDSIIIEGMFDDSSITQFKVGETTFDVVESMFSIELDSGANLGVGAKQIVVVPIDGNNPGEPITINFTVVEEPASQPEEGGVPEDGENPDEGGVPEDGEDEGGVPKDEVNEEILDEVVSEQKFVPDYVPGVFPSDTENLSREQVATGKSIYYPIEDDKTRFPHRRNLADVHAPLFGNMTHPDMVDKVDGPKTPKVGSKSNLQTGGVTL